MQYLSLEKLHLTRARFVSDSTLIEFVHSKHHHSKPLGVGLHSLHKAIKTHFLANVHCSSFEHQPSCLHGIVTCPFGWHGTTRSTTYRGTLLPASVPIRIRFDRFVIRLNDCSIPWSRIISLKQYNFTRIVIKFGQLHRLPSSVKNMLKVRRSKGEAPTVAVMDIDLETHERAQEFLEHLVSLGCVRVVYGFLRWNKRYVPVMFTSVSMDSM